MIDSGDSKDATTKPAGDSAAAQKGDITNRDFWELWKKFMASVSGFFRQMNVDEKLREPAPSGDAPTKQGYDVCLDCGEKVRWLERHVLIHHRESIEEYHARWNRAGAKGGE